MRAAVTSGFGGPERLEVRDDVLVGRVVEGGAGVEAGWLGRRVLVDHTLHDDGASEQAYALEGIHAAQAAFKDKQTAGNFVIRVARRDS